MKLPAEIFTSSYSPPKQMAVVIRKEFKKAKKILEKKDGLLKWKINERWKTF